MQKGTKDKARIEGRSLLQRHGYNGFSFQDIAEKLNIKKPSLYDHFSSKDELVVAIVRDYSVQFDAWIQTITSLSPIDRIRKVFDVFYSFSCDKRKICPILALAVDFQGLDKSIQKEMKLFVEKWLTWLEKQIVEGQEVGEVRKDMNANMLATFIYSQGMGAQFQARIKNDPSLALISGDQIVTLIKS